VGIHVRGGTSIGTVLAHNRISNNDVAAQGANLDGNASFGNGGQWSSGRIIAVWTIAVAVWLALLVLTWVSRRNTSRHAATRRTRRSAVG
jgi:protein-S-isoprenylcysteine O-methyltransferase Ste14